MKIPGLFKLFKLKFNGWTLVFEKGLNINIVYIFKFQSKLNLTSFVNHINNWISLKISKR